MIKLRNNRGETLIEVLASVLIGTLSVTLLFGCIAVSSKLDTDAKVLDSAYYAGFAEADAQVTPAPAPGAAAPTVPVGQVTVARINPDDPSAAPMATATPAVEIYGGAGIFSYKG